MSEGLPLSALSPSSRNARRAISYNAAAGAHSTVDDAPVNFGEGDEIHPQNQDASRLER